MYHYTDIPLPWDYLCKYSLLLSNDLTSSTHIFYIYLYRVTLRTTYFKHARTDQCSLQWTEGSNNIEVHHLALLHGNLIAACRQNIRAGDVKVTTNCTGDTELNNS